MSSAILAVNRTESMGCSIKSISLADAPTNTFQVHSEFSKTPKDRANLTQHEVQRTMSRQITLDDLKLLIDVVKALDPPKTLEAAERNLKLDGYPTLDLSKWMGEIEVLLGGPKAKSELLALRGRGKTQAVLKPIAHELASTAQRMLKAWHQQLEEIETARQRVNVAMSNALVGSFFPQLLLNSGYLARHPNVDIKIVEGEPDENIRRVTQLDVHFAVGPKGNIPENCEFESLCKWPRVLLFKHDDPKYARYKGLNMDVLRSVLQDETVIVPPRTVMSEVDDFLMPTKKGRRIKIPQAVHRHAYVLAGLGLAISHLATDPSGKDNGLVWIDLTSELGSTEICIYFAKSKGIRQSLPAHVQELADAVIATLRTDP